MAEKQTIEKLEEQDFASEVGKQESSQEIADAKLFQESNNALQERDEELLDPDSPDFEQMYYDVAEEADDELDSDNDYEEIQPLNIKKTKTGKDVDQGMQFRLVSSVAERLCRRENVAERIKAEGSLVSSFVNKLF